ncbi:MAG: sugar ABC transporter ATP-binding protein, partial [Candidatus Bipolaricaulia bacterium]
MPAQSDNPAVPRNNKMLELWNVSKTFPGVKALSKIDFDVEAGEVHVLLGENGAGKSTLIKIIAGVVRKDEGELLIEGNPVEIASPALAREIGVSVIYQELNLIPHLDVCNNVFLGRTAVRKDAWGRLLGWKDTARMMEECQRPFEEMGIDIDPKAVVRELALSDRQLVEIARALSLNPRIILMDEPTSSLGSDEKERLFGIIKTLKDRGIGVVYVSHILEEVFRVGDRVTVLRDGEKIGTERIEEVSIDGLIRMMTGRTFKERYPKISGRVSDTILEVRGLTRRGVFEDITFSLTKGEILGFAGLVGARRTDLARALVGAEKADGGSVLLEGRPVRIRSPQEAIAQGIVLLTEDRKQQGLFNLLSVHDNIVVSSLNKKVTAKSTGIVRLSHLVNFGRTRAICNGFVEDLNIRTPSLEQAVQNLSGGNQQKVLLARGLSTEAKVIILDEPTKGVDAGAKVDIYQILERLAKAGVAIIVISSELPEVMSICNRILVMRRGRITGEFSRESATETAIMKCATL